MSVGTIAQALGNPRREGHDVLAELRRLRLVARLNDATRLALVAAHDGDHVDSARRSARGHKCHARNYKLGEISVIRVTPVDIATKATWGEPSGTKERSRRMVLWERWPISKNTLREFSSVQLPNGLQIDDIALHIRGGRAWESFPGRPMLDADGRQVMQDGRRPDVSIIRWRSRDLAERFSAALVELVLEANPDAFDEASPG